MYISTSISSAEGVGPVASCPEAKKQRLGTNKTILLAMKLTAFFLMIGFLHLSAHTTAQQRISITLKGATLERIFIEIEKRSGYTVFYNMEVLKTAGANLLTLDVKDATIEDVMNKCLKGLPLQFTVQDKTVFVKKEGLRAELTIPFGPGSPTAQFFSGIIKSESGVPLAGATVYIEKIKKTALTDKEGQFSIKNIPDGDYDVLISYVGYEARKMKVSIVKNEAWLSAELKLSMSNLDETVVKGYYSTTNRLNTGDVTTIKGETMQEQPVSDPILALVGRVPGLYIQQTTGAPGAYSTIQIMGQNSIANGNDPLYIVDGVPFSSVSLSSTAMSAGAIPTPSSNISNINGGGVSPFNLLNPADIETVSVLKDADATSIYGSRGANGVILITTKRGKSGATRLDMNVYTGSGSVTRMMHLLNTPQYLEMRREAFKNDGLQLPSITTSPDDNNYDINGWWDTTRYTNWQKVLVGNPAYFTNAQSSITGGNINTQFIFGGGYSNQGTAFIGSYYDQKASAHLNVTHTSSDQKFHMQVGVNYVYDYNHLPTGDFTGSVALAPDAPSLYNHDGSINWAIKDGTATFSNPAASLLQSSNASSTNLITNMALSYQLFPGLQVKGNFGYNKEEMHESFLNPAASSAPPNNVNPSDRYIQFANTEFNTWIIEPQIDFTHHFSLGQFEFLTGSTFQENVHNSLTQFAQGFSSDALITNPLAASSTSYSGIYYSQYHYNALYTRLSYNVDDKYIVNLTARRDGSSRFGPGKQFGNFGAAGLAWIFSKEHFIEKQLPVLSFGKIRASYGVTGNDQIGDYQYLSTYSALSTAYESTSGLYPTQLTNPNFAWEVDKKMQLGMELGFLRDSRILLSATYYRNRTSNQLLGEPLPQITGFSSVEINLPAVVQNSGGEFTISTVNVRSKLFNWTTSANLTIPRNKLVAFPNFNEFQAYKYSYVVGKSLFIKEVYKNTGVNPQTGLLSFATKNASGEPSYPQDLVSSSPVTQKYYGGLRNTFVYRGFQLDIFVQYVNQLGYNYRNSFFPPAGWTNKNQPTAILERWTGPGDITAIQRFGTNFSVFLPYLNLLSSNRVISDASFLRLKSLSFSYILPTSWNNKMHLQKVRLYLQCQNLLTITRYVGMDPETGGLNLPPLRMVTAGIQVNI